MKITQYILIGILFLPLAGCFLFPDNTPPVPGNDGNINIDSATSTQVSISWTEASDNRSSVEDLEYLVYYTSTGSLSTAEEISRNGTSYSSWTNKTSEIITDLETGKSYYITVVVRDKSDNRAIYQQTSVDILADSITLTPALNSYYHITNALDSFNLTLNLGTEAKTVYFAFSNVSNVNVQLPEVTSESSSKGFYSDDLTYDKTKEPLPAAHRGSPAITEFNSNPPSFGKHSDRAITKKALSDSEGDTKTFYDWVNDDIVSIPATCAKVVTADTEYGEKELSIWVADEYWNGSSTPKVTQDMVDAMADKFLKTGLENDIYDWVTAIFGEEWGTHSQQKLIPENDNITILLYDIGNDYDPDKGGIVGYFWAKDNYFSDAGSGSITSSNERIMFYIDAPFYATVNPDEGSWDINDFWPQEIISTLAHEFHHMIHFYQKAVLRTGTSGGVAWLQELLSMATEDLLADKLQVTGPRGVDPSDGSAGSLEIIKGRLPLYNLFNDTPLLYWPGYNSQEVLKYYSVNYAFGAYLGRNYGGAKLMGDIVKNPYVDFDAITEALDQNGYTLDISDLMTRWAAANFLSDSTDLDEGYQYNTGDWFESESGGITYNLGSINLFNYTYTDAGQTGPWFYTQSPVADQYYTAHPAYSNLYLLAADSAAGTKSWDITVGTDVIVTVIVK